MEKEQLKIEYISLDEIKPNEYNPKKMTEKEEKDLEKSITEFGIVDPLIINKAKGRKGIIIGGHQRYKIYKKLNYKKVPVVWINVPDLKKEKELCLRLSKNTGSWDWDLLINFDEDLLKEVGFEDDELLLKQELLDEKTEEIRPYHRTHILLSFEPEKMILIKKYLDKILEIEGIEYEQSSN